MSDEQTTLDDLVNCQTWYARGLDDGFVKGVKSHLSDGQVKELLRLLSKCRAVIAEELHVRLTSLCLLDPDLEPNLDTLTPDDRLEVEPLQDLLREIDAELSAATTSSGESE